MNRKQKILKKTAKRAKARLNKHTPPNVKKYVSKGDRAKALAQEQAETAAKANELAKMQQTDETSDTLSESAAQETAENSSQTNEQ